MSDSAAAHLRPLGFICGDALSLLDTAESGGGPGRRERAARLEQLIREAHELGVSRSDAAWRQNLQRLLSVDTGRTPLTP